VRGGDSDAPRVHPTRLGRGPSRSRWIPALAVVAAVGLLATLFGFGLRRDPSVLQPALNGKAAPAFSLKTLDGRGDYSLEKLRGQVVVLNFWASWCADCRVEHSTLQEAFDRYRDQKVVFLGVSFEDQESAARTFARQLGVGWPLLADPGSATAIHYGVSGVPETFVIGPDGRIVGKTSGPVAYATLSTQIASAASGGS
jgi:cytochrome c biogenesis protein CcmG/thiol:disulfide interchange protein DsbE